MASSVGSAEPIYLTPVPLEDEQQQHHHQNYAAKQGENCMIFLVPSPTVSAAALRPGPGISMRGKRYVHCSNMNLCSPCPPSPAPNPYPSRVVTASVAPAPEFVTKSVRYNIGHPTVCSPSSAFASATPPMHRATESIRKELALKKSKNSVFTPPQSPSVSWGQLPGTTDKPELAVIDMAAQQASWMMLGKSRADIKWWAQHLAKDGPVGGYLVRVSGAWARAFGRVGLRIPPTFSVPTLLDSPCSVGPLPWCSSRSAPLRKWAE